MTDEQKILLALVKLMFPREMLDYFEVVGFELHEASLPTLPGPTSFWRSARERSTTPAAWHPTV